MEGPVDSMTTPCDSEASRLLPWFVSGRLATADVARVETHLADCATCRAELEEQRALRDVLLGGDRVEFSPQPSLQKLVTRIDELDRELPAPAPEPTLASPAPVHRVAGRRGVTHWLVAALVLQTVGLALLSALVWNRAPSVEDRAAAFRTLSSAPAAPAVGAPRLRVVFAPGTDIGQVTALLQDARARIVDGPSPAGTFALVLDVAGNDRDAVQAAIRRLRADARIVFAEPIPEAARPVQ
jgi:anti-sigma factor RsiW